MSDIGTKFADKRIRYVDSRISTEYRQAEKELNEKLADFVRKSAERDRIKRKQRDEGLISEQDYKDWLAGQVFIRKRWESKVKQASEVLHTHNLQANKIIHENAMDVFRENYNYSAFTAEMGTGVSFDLINEQTVINLAKKNPQLLPEWKIDEEKDYKWNYRKANNAVMQGIIQGESVEKIAKRMAKNLCTQNKNKMRLFARTAITGAQNGGRQAQMEAAAEDGIEQKKEWVATLDGRTRDSHRKLDGQQVGVNESFDGEFGKIMFPGDPTAHPAEVYNCRCAMITVYPKYAGFVGKTPRRAKGEYTDKDGNKRSFSYLTQDPEMYEKWKNEKAKEKKQSTTRQVVQGKDITGTWTRREGKFDFEIQDVINAQGFDGLPKIVSKEEFDKAVTESNFIAQRTYAAPDMETLNAYRDMLYNGEWYVDCSEGGSQYGQGMYCAADYTGKLSKGIQNEMAHYQELAVKKANSTTITWGNMQMLKPENTNNKMFSYTETLTLTPDAKIIKYVDLRKMYQDEMYEMLGKLNEKEFTEWSEKRISDLGSYAAAKGYDAINAEGHGESGSYTVVLNRTKCIFLGGT